MVSGMISGWEKSAAIRGLGTALWQRSLVKSFLTPFWPPVISYEAKNRFTRS
jgi:hypothetical protein